MKNEKFKGVVVPMVTPLTIDGNIDKEAVKKIIDHFAKSGVSPLLMGTNGEGNLLSRKQCSSLVDAAVKASGGRIVIYSCLTGTSVDEQIEAAAEYKELGVDVIVSTLPAYYALTDDQMIEYYTYVADHVESPFMLYNITSTTHMSIPVNVVEFLSHHPNIYGIKDSERDMERMKAIVEIKKTNPAFAYFCGWAAQSVYSLSIGGDGIVPSTGNFVPKMFADLYDAVESGNKEEAQRLQDETNTIAKIYQEGRTLGKSLAALKIMMHTLGLCSPYMFRPLNRLSEEEEKKVAQLSMAVKF